MRRRKKKLCWHFVFIYLSPLSSLILHLMEMKAKFYRFSEKIMDFSFYALFWYPPSKLESENVKKRKRCGVNDKENYFKIAIVKHSCEKLNYTIRYTKYFFHLLFRTFFFHKKFNIFVIVLLLWLQWKEFILFWSWMRKRTNERKFCRKKIFFLPLNAC